MHDEFDNHREVVHGESLGKEIPRASEELEFLMKTALFFMGLICGVESTASLTMGFDPAANLYLGTVGKADFVLFGVCGFSIGIDRQAIEFLKGETLRYLAFVKFSCSTALRWW